MWVEIPNALNIIDYYNSNNPNQSTINGYWTATVIVSICTYHLSGSLLQLCSVDLHSDL